MKIPLIHKIYEVLAMAINTFLIFIFLLTVTFTPSLQSIAISSNNIKVSKYSYLWDNFTLFDFNKQLIEAANYNIDTIYFNIEFFLNPYLNQSQSFQQIKSQNKGVDVYR